MSGVSNIAVDTIPNGAGRQQLFALIGGQVYSRFQTDTAGNWSSPELFDSDLTDDVKVGYLADGRMAFFEAQGGAIWSKAKVSTSGNADWGGWQRVASSQRITRLATARLQDGRPQILAIKDHAVWQTYWDGSGWAAPSTF